MMLILLFFCAISYLFGSIPFGIIIAKLKNVDLRSVGSGNIGATNVARSCGKFWAFLTFLLDGLKALVPALIAKNFIDQDLVFLVLLSGILGHIYSCFCKFKGGKGFATTLISFFAISPTIATAIIACWIAVFVISRYSSLSTIISIITGFIIALASRDYITITFAFTTMAIILYTHRGNIKRLVKGSENKF